MNTSSSIEPLRNADSSQIIQLILPIQQQEFGVPVTIEDQPDLLDIERYYFKTGGGFWGIKDQHQLLGTIALIKLPENQGGVIRKMFVRKAFRGKELGIAQRLLDGLVDYAVKNAIQDLYLGTVDLLKAAIRFYERNGFTPINKTELPSHFPIMGVDNLFYHLKIKISDHERH